MTKWWDIKGSQTRLLEAHRKRKLNALRRRVNKFFDNLETRGGVLGDSKTAVLFVYNDEAPEKSYILTEQL